MSEYASAGEPDVAFFDVDETLISVKSMFRFLDFYLEARGEAPGTYRRLAGELQQMAGLGVPREAVNRAYYRLYAGESERRLARLGAQWFAQESQSAGFWLAAAVSEHDRLRRQGAATVLVSGSFFACLDPIAEALDASDVLGAPVVIRDGRLTGEIGEPMIGRGKEHAALNWLTRQGLSPSRCSAYGDHLSDVPLLQAVGTPVVVGDEPQMASLAEQRGWRRLPYALTTA
ncbi:HAD-IB family hydrolase [Streptomyces sp. LHD-70]|uniref:HAD family hydrolase n=1 Tax=Streptomyces sp. LHD-70 TaxID=3072140 RepID=UPI00280DB8E2|nr:HAD-IB family hydrolase [Streptomyces sp. LHD-70]MDQ8701131.1 HAD-IB family hydrolase [Streptomyces sp. LHD-70]